MGCRYDLRSGLLLFVIVACICAPRVTRASPLFWEGTLSIEVLGLPPIWYKSAPYRSRAVIDPRGILREFGTELSDEVEVRVWDSTAELRYFVLPERPAGTEGMSEEQLAALVTRDAMVGVAKVTHTLRGHG